SQRGGGAWTAWITRTVAARAIPDPAANGPQVREPDRAATATDRHPPDRTRTVAAPADRTRTNTADQVNRARCPAATGTSSPSRVPPARGSPPRRFPTQPGPAPRSAAPVNPRARFRSIRHRRSRVGGYWWPG